jgi:hypothetical protein
MNANEEMLRVMETQLLKTKNLNKNGNADIKNLAIFSVPFDADFKKWKGMMNCMVFLCSRTNDLYVDCMVFYLPCIYTRAEILSVRHPNVVTYCLNEPLTLCNDDNPQQTRTLTEGDTIIVAGDITHELVPCRLSRSRARMCVRHDFGHVHNPRIPRKPYILTIFRPHMPRLCIHIRNNHIHFIQEVLMSYILCSSPHSFFSLTSSVALNMNSTT